MAYQVTTPVFEGPFDLLLHLISREEVDIYDVPLARIVDAYLTELTRMESLDLDVATEFLLIAATLVELKARRLLPGRDELEIDEELLFEERDLLLARLLECKTFKDAAHALDDLRQRASHSIGRSAGPEEPFASMMPDPLERVTVDQFLKAAARAFAPKPPDAVSFAHVNPIRVTVREAIGEVLQQLPPDRSLSFRQLTAGCEERIDVVMKFLAVLELFKRGIVELDQALHFGELLVRRTTDLEDVDLSGLEEWEEVAMEGTWTP